MMGIMLSVMRELKRPQDVVGGYARPQGENEWFCDVDKNKDRKRKWRVVKMIVVNENIGA